MKKGKYGLVKQLMLISMISLFQELMPMINPIAMHDLFKPYELDFVQLEDVLASTGLSLEEMLKINVEDECSKSIDESCFNLECDYNYVGLHNDELYVKVAGEIQAERREIEERTQSHMKKYAKSF